MNIRVAHTDIIAPNELTVIEFVDRYIAPEESKYSQTVTVARGTLLMAAGIDESNTNDGFITLPDQPHVTAALVRDCTVSCKR